MLAFLKDALAQLDAPSPPDSPATLRQMAFVQQLVMLDQEVRKGPRGHPLVVDHADVPRDEIWRRRLAGDGIVESCPAPISQVLSTRAGAVDRPAQDPVAATATPLAATVEAKGSAPSEPIAPANSGPAPLLSVAPANTSLGAPAPAPIRPP